MTSKRLVFTVAAVTLGGACSVHAADLAARPYMKASPAIASVYDWTGFYIGANAGYGWARDSHSDIVPGGGIWTNAGGTQVINPSGAVYGGQLGYNWQSANWVLGLEGQFNGSSINRTDISVFFPLTDRLSSKVDFYTTVTGRIGYAFDHWLPYIKGGYAGANLKVTNFDTLGVSFAHNDWYNGFVVGAGLEYAWAGSWIIGVEYNYMNLGRQTAVGLDSPPQLIAGAVVPEAFSDRLSIQAVTGRLSYRFGGPVVAKY